MKDKILITGQEGMVGSSIYKFLKKFNIIDCKRRDLDFTRQSSENGLKKINQILS